MFAAFEKADPAGLGMPALITAQETLSWADLLQEMDRFETEVRGKVSHRPLVMLEASNTPGPVIAYLAALRAGWPVIPVTKGAAAPSSAIRRSFQPCLVVTDGGDESWRIDYADAPPADLHPDLAVLLSTSGTTGAAKLVRLSRQNLLSNAGAIAEYLGVTAEDRAITALPFHYSYGMSVLHVQMLMGAPTILTDHSVTEPAFLVLAREAGATSLALVPTQFEMLDAEGWDRTRLPTLRYMTQAGGRLDPGLAQRFAERAEAEEWELFLMYGQTEAGPRMAYLPPRDALTSSDSIGQAIPGGRFRLVDADGSEITGTGSPGELIFEGPGVMQGYALERTDLAAPEGPPVLHTGDIAERLETGYFRILGRSARFLKLHGLRIGLDEVELRLRENGARVYATGRDDTGVVLFLKDGTAAEAGALADRTSRAFNLPPDLVRVAPIDDVPLMPSGKIDYRALADRAARLAPTPGSATLGPLLARVLRTPDPDLMLSFRDHGGDSLGYLSVQLHFSEHGIPLPEEWDTLALSELLALDTSGQDSLSPDTRSLGGRVFGTDSLTFIDANLYMRVMALLAVIALHATSWPTGGGSFLLLALIGYSLGRFQFAPLARRQVGGMLVSMLLPILTAYYALILATDLLWRPIPGAMYLLTANLHPNWAIPEPYWFVSTYAQLILLAALPFLIPPVARAISARPFLAGLTGLAGSVILFAILGVGEIPFEYRHRHPVGAFELMMLGWCAWFANSGHQRLLMTALIPAAWLLHWSDLYPGTALLCFAGLVTVLWRLKLPAPAWLFRAVVWTGSLALYAYICHAAVISATVRLLPLLPELPRFLIVLTISLILARGMRWVYDMAMTQMLWLAGTTRTGAE